MSLPYPVIKYSKIPFLNIIQTLRNGSCMYSSFFRMCKIYKISLANTYFSECELIEDDEDFFIDCVKEKLARFVEFDNSSFLRDIFTSLKSIMPVINNRNRNTFGINNRPIKKVVTNMKYNNDTKFDKFKKELKHKILNKTAYATQIEYSLLHHLLPDIINKNVLNDRITEHDFHTLQLDENKLIFFSSGLHYEGMITDEKLAELYRPSPSSSNPKPSPVQKSTHRSASTPKHRAMPIQSTTPKPRGTMSRAHITVNNNNNKTNKHSKTKKNNNNKSPKPELPPRSYPPSIPERSYRITFGLNRRL
jgi:hypothetical protein